MRAIQVPSWDSSPKFTTTATKPEAPPTDSDQIQIKVIAAGLHRLVRSQSDGSHYSVKSATLPYTLGSDGVGTTNDGTMVYFSSLATGGSFAEYINVPKRACIPLPKSANPSQVAALVNPGMSSWMAIRTRLEPRLESFTVLILGATSVSGQVAVNIARHLGATKIIGLARDLKALQSLALDETIVLQNPVEKTEFSSAASLQKVDVILDYLYGPAAVHCLNSLLPNHPVQYVQIGSLAAQDTPFPAALLRSKNITLRGSGPGAWTMPELGSELPSMIKAVSELPKFDVKERKLEEIDIAWKEIKERTVFVL